MAVPKSARNGQRVTSAAANELEAASARLRRLANTTDQGRDASMHRTPGAPPLAPHYRRADLPASADPANPYGTFEPSPLVGERPVTVSEIADLGERVREVSDGDGASRHELRGYRSGCRCGACHAAHALHIAKRRIAHDEERDSGSDSEGPLLAVGSTADADQSGLPFIKGELRLLDDPCHQRVVLTLNRGARVVNASGHRSTPSVGQAPDETGPDDGALGAATPGAEVPTVGVPTDIDAGVLLSPGSVGGGSVEGAVHGAPSTVAESVRYITRDQANIAAAALLWADASFSDRIRIRARVAAVLTALNIEVR